MSARELILSALRQGNTATAAGEPNDAGAIAAAADALIADLSLGRPRLGEGSLPMLFERQITSPKVAASLDKAASLADVPRAVDIYLTTHGLAREIALQPEPALTAMDWSGYHLHEEVKSDTIVAVGKALWGIAETGTLVFHSGPHSPTLFDFFPLHHLVVIEASRILGYLEDYVAASMGQPVPRNVNFVTGASGTTDIEGTLVRGAHGPRFLHVILVEDS